MKDVTADPALVACCGLYCAACGAHRRGRCAGCAKTDQRAWCKVRSCCQGRSIATCADCADFGDPRDCRKYHNVISRVIGLVLRSDRRACIARIREVGRPAFAEEMAAKGAQTIRR